MTNPLLQLRNVVSQWFGDGFAQLHPLLQTMHREGAVLQGPARVFCGKGVAGMLGHHFARRLGVPLEGVSSSGEQRLALEVRIAHTATHLVWTRRFTSPSGQVSEVVSLFEPVGHYPDGHWMETTGRMRFKLAVDVTGGGWYWRVLGVSLAGFRLPVWLLPRAQAYKRVEGEAYRFKVGFALPLLGKLFCYEGLLQAVPTITVA